MRMKMDTKWRSQEARDRSARIWLVVLLSLITLFYMALGTLVMLHHIGRMLAE